MRCESTVCIMVHGQRFKKTGIRIAAISRGRLESFASHSSGKGNVRPRPNQRTLSCLSHELAFPPGKTSGDVHRMMEGFRIQRWTSSARERRVQLMGIKP